MAKGTGYKDRIFLTLQGKTVICRTRCIEGGLVMNILSTLALPHRIDMTLRPKFN